MIRSCIITGTDPVTWDTSEIKRRFGVPEGYHLVLDAVSAFTPSGAAASYLWLAIDMAPEEYAGKYSGADLQRFSNEGVMVIPLIALTPVVFPFYRGMPIRERIVLECAGAVSPFINWEYHFERGEMNWRLESRDRERPSPLTPDRTPGDPFYQTRSRRQLGEG